VAEYQLEEKVSFDASYASERMIALLFLPRNATPPYQTVVLFPGSDATWYNSSKIIADSRHGDYIDFILANGRAVLWPIYKGTYERRKDFTDATSLHGGDETHRYVEYLIQVVKDFKRSIDYLESREDIDSKRLAFMGISWGGFLGNIIPAVEERLQASIERLRWLSLPLGLVLAAAQVPLLGLEEAPAFGTWRYALGWGARALGSWCCILAILGFGRKYLNFSTPFLGYANEAVLPFYILHQTVLLCVGYFVLRWAIPDLLQWAIILLASFTLIMVIYELLVRRYNVMRFLFGMKLKPKAPAAQSQRAAASGSPGS